MSDIKLFLLNNKKWLIVPTILVLLSFLIIYKVFVNEKGDEYSRGFKNEELLLETIENSVYTESEMIKEKGENSEFISVDIKGRVKKPGVYRVDVSLNRRISDVITMAGGLLNDADTSVTNLAKKIFDEMVIIIYSKEEVLKFSEILEKENIQNQSCQKECDSCIQEDNVVNNSSSETVNDKENNNELVNHLININTATLEELTTLNGIGNSKALAIIEYRTQTPFKKIEDIMNVKGIGENAYNQIKDNITV